MSPKNIKLIYFDAAGRAEAIRLAFAIGGVAFEDVRLSGAEFAAAKASGAFKNGQLPVIEVDGVQYAQSNALLRFAGNLSGLYPTDYLKALAVDEVLINAEEFGSKISPIIYGKDEDSRAAALKEALEVHFPAWLGRFEAALAKNGTGYWVGDSLTIADLRTFGVDGYFAQLPGVGAEYLNAYPHVLANLAKVKSHPKVVEYYKSKAAKQIPKLKLTYFDMGGRAEAIRLALTVAGVPFEDERIAGPEFGARKASGAFKFGSVPVIEIDGVQHAQSNAILTYAGSFSKLTPTEPLALLEVNEVLHSIEDAVSAISKLWGEKDAEKLKILSDELTAEGGALHKWIQRFDNQLAKNGSGYFVGSDLTVADLKAYTFFDWFIQGAFTHISKDWVLGFSNIAAFQSKVASHPKIAEYYANKK